MTHVHVYIHTVLTNVHTYVHTYIHTYIHQVNVFKALKHFQPSFKQLQHPHFRVLLAHAILTLGKVEFGKDPTADPADARAADEHQCYLTRFKDGAGNPKNEKHQCGYCTNRCYLYCPICFLGAENGDLTVIDYGICNPATGRNCYAKHVTGVKNTHHMHMNLPQRTSPRVERRRARTEEGEGEEPEPRSGRMDAAPPAAGDR